MVLFRQNLIRSPKTLNIGRQKGIFRSMVSLRGAFWVSPVFWFPLAIGFAAVQPLSGQPSTSELRIEVKDPSGAAVAATGRLENLFSGTVRRFETDAQGLQTFT